MGHLKRFVQNEEAHGTAEYGLVLAIIAIGLVAAVVAFRDGLVEVIDDLSAEFSGAMRSGG